MLKSLRNLFSAAPAPYADPKGKIPLSEVLKHDWFELWYQPKIELKTMRLVGAEALVRARHPQRGVVAPFFFLPEASEDDMLKLTEQVILTALGDWDVFNENGVAMKSAVNVPVSAFVKLPIPRMLREARPRAANWPGMVLEVTEARSSTISISPTTSPTRCASSTARSRSTISAPTILHSRG